MALDLLYLPAGSLRHKVTIQKPTTTRNAWGENSQTWQTFLTTRASIRSLTSRELATQEMLSSQGTHEVKMHYPGTSVRIVPGQRLVCGTTTYTVQGVENVLERNRVVKLTCLAIDQTTQP